ncbi:hypothetical protein CRENBAI_001523 [Crenichthys baileyi]|uniref:Uncharacterized protein n=1 Tax=Crenichthys baileyi TaxID=28760 RepID=A0AAV9SFJ1_9TELE
MYSSYTVDSGSLWVFTLARECRGLPLMTAASKVLQQPSVDSHTFFCFPSLATCGCCCLKYQELKMFWPPEDDKLVADLCNQMFTHFSAHSPVRANSVYHCPVHFASSAIIILSLYKIQSHLFTVCL